MAPAPGVPVQIHTHAADTHASWDALLLPGVLSDVSLAAAPFPPGAGPDPLTSLHCAQLPAIWKTLDRPSLPCSASVVSLALPCVRRKGSEGWGEGWSEAFPAAHPSGMAAWAIQTGLPRLPQDTLLRIRLPVTKMLQVRNEYEGHMAKLPFS